MAVESEIKEKEAEERLNSAKESIAKLEYIGIENEFIKEDLFKAYNAFKSREYDEASKYASIAKKKSDELKNLYQDTCIAIASAGDCMKDAKDHNKDITHPLNLLISAKKSFEKNKFDKAFKLALQSCAEAAKIAAVDVNIMAPAEKTTNRSVKSICKWRIPITGSSASICLHMLASNYRKRCSDDFECEFSTMAEN